MQYGFIFYFHVLYLYSMPSKWQTCVLLYRTRKMRMSWRIDANIKPTSNYFVSTINVTTLIVLASKAWNINHNFSQFHKSKLSTSISIHHINIYAIFLDNATANNNNNIREKKPTKWYHCESYRIFSGFPGSPGIFAWI